MLYDGLGKQFEGLCRLAILVERVVLGLVVGAAVAVPALIWWLATHVTITLK